jgi:hypothetical protein
MTHCFVKLELGFAPPRAYTYAWEGDEEVQRVVPPNTYNPAPAIGRVLRTMPNPDFAGDITVLKQKASTEAIKRPVRQSDRYVVTAELNRKIDEMHGPGAAAAIDAAIADGSIFGDDVL